MRRTADQRELSDVVRRFFQESVPSEYLRKRFTSGLRRDESLLDSMKQLGLEEGLAADEPTLSFSDLALVSSEVGRALVPEPLIERLVFDAYLPRHLSSTTQRAYQGLISGPGFTAVAPAACCKLSINSKSKTVSGEVSWAFGVEGANRLVAFATKGLTSHVIVVSLSHSGVKVAPVSSLDLTASLSSISLVDVPVVVFKEMEAELVEDCFEIVKACEVAGAAERVIEMTAEYVKTREQFGVPVGAFQAIQQRLADAYAASEALGALCRFAAWSVVHSPHQRPLTARAAISYAGDVGPTICESAVQCHGGIGFTWEYDLHLFLRRAKSIQAAFPSTSERVDHLLRRAKEDKQANQST